MTRLRKAAVDNGFDLELAAVDGWQSYVSTKAPLKIWLRSVNAESLDVALSQISVARELGVRSTQETEQLPSGAVAVIEASGFDGLHRVLRRAFQLSRALPNALLQRFEDVTKDAPRATEVERLVIQRVGQSMFRDGLLELWEGCCAITGLDVVELLRASHSKPWADCESDAERLDIYNGLLLAPQLDALFDRGFMTVRNDGTVLLSERLSKSSRECLGLQENMSVRRLTDAHRRYLDWHVNHVFTEK